MNAYDVLLEHHNLLRQLGRAMSQAPVGSAQRQRCTDELLREFDIHMRIEDDLYYPAMSAASTLIAIAHAEHRQIYDQLAVALRTHPKAPHYQAEWDSFLTVLEAHADEEERDLIPPPAPVNLTATELEDLGQKMCARMHQLRTSPMHKLRVKTRAALLAAF
ncbi:hemerythrin domain-containing protein [Mycobacteroides abscessus]|uniref:hemerythrin domain-containing protein n=1 Tax=Mycobacteroides abscessus TaxID=36809 RepID=UPI003AAB0D82